MIRLRVNTTQYAAEAKPDASLLSVLRDQVGLTGTNYGCGEGQCGACTVLIDGQPRRSCLTPVSAVGAGHILTIEGLEDLKNGRLHPLQQAFLDEEAFQCGYCTSGMILTGAAFLKDHPQPTDEDIVRAMDGNICRCGTYPRILAAIRKAAGAMKAS